MPGCIQHNKFVVVVLLASLPTWYAAARWREQAVLHCWNGCVWKVKPSCSRHVKNDEQAVQHYYLQNDRQTVQHYQRSASWLA